MLTDAHVHMGYYPRAGYDEPFYYSPRRVLGVLDRCGVGEFIVSSTCAQVEGVSVRDMIREVREMKRLAGSRAHVFCWISGRMYDADPKMGFLDCGCYEGIKLHEGDTAWNGERRNALERILMEARNRGWPVQFHGGENPGSRPTDLAVWAERFPTVNFDIAHCRPMPEMAQVVAAHTNVFTDCAYMDAAIMPRLSDFDWKGRLLFGSDFPAYQACVEGGFSDLYRQYLSRWEVMGCDAETAFMRFLR